LVQGGWFDPSILEESRVRGHAVEDPQRKVHPILSDICCVEEEPRGAMELRGPAEEFQKGEMAKAFKQVPNPGNQGGGADRGEG
jgi:hypothetical protein